MTSAVASDQRRRQEAAQIVERFVRRFDESYRVLAYHAALPLVLTPELVNYLRNRFLRGEQVPWVAEVDLLLSDLCRPVGYELYVMDTAVRAYLLESIKDDPFWQQRMREVAQVLISYVSYLSQISPGRRPELEAQRWAAMVYLGDEECLSAAEEIAERLQASGSAMSSANGAASGLRAELARLTRITQELAPQLQAHQSLVEYARVVQQVLKRPESVELEEVQASYQVGDRELRVPEPIVPTRLVEAVRLAAVAEQATIVGFPPLQAFEFRVATVQVLEGTDQPQSAIDWRPFSFDVAVIVEVNQLNQLSLEEQVEVLDNAIFATVGKRLQEIERTILIGKLEGGSYQEISGSIRSSVPAIRKRVAQIWQKLTPILGEKVDGRTVTGAFKRWVEHQEVEIQRSKKQAFQFIEMLPGGVPLEMVSIPSGTFIMGSPKHEEGRSNDESPQHSVTVSSFSMGKYPVTQVQWRAVAALPQVNRELNSDPSEFKGDDRPVEQVSWYDAIEFCDRLSQRTGKMYRLSSEAEWEYACRAKTMPRTSKVSYGVVDKAITPNQSGRIRFQGTYWKAELAYPDCKRVEVGEPVQLVSRRGITWLVVPEGYGTSTPFHFGETITPDLANYNTEYSYRNSLTQKSREETTLVGSFGVANNFGLYDMHGNVWEWCLDHWHDNYEGAPTDGNAWLTNNEEVSRVLRGGSWCNDPQLCRSAFRGNFDPAYHGNVNSNVGFRVVCSAPRTQ